MRTEDVRFEPKDINPVAVIGAGLGVLIGTLLIVGLLWFLFSYLRSTHPDPEPRPGPAPEFGSIRQPLLQPSPALDLQTLRARDNRILNGYNWVDRNKGIVSIPIYRAIDKLITSGPPAQRDYSDLKLLPPRAGSRDTGF